MRFWDSSALLPLFIAEPSTGQVERWLRADPAVTVWAFTRLELLSALAQRRRAEPRQTPRFRAVRREVLSVAERWTEIAALEGVRRHAERLVETHALRAAEALQLGAALVAAEENPARLQVVTLDARLGDAAEKEGFQVLGPR
jgi:predicted nucleic acid-binding protein